MVKTKSIFKLFAVLMSVSMIIMMFSVIPLKPVTVSAICCRKDGFDKSRYTLTGNMAEDVAAIAKSQKGRTEAQFGYSGVDAGAWCDEFVADCLENAGADSSIVAHGGTVADFESKMRARNAVAVSSPQTGDLIFFTKSHVEIVTKVENGVVYCAGGNNGGRMCKGERTASSVGTTRLFLRPNYPNPVHSTLSVTQGNSSTDTIFNWSDVPGASEYDIKIWKDVLWEGNPYLIEWGIKTNSWKTVLPEGTYYAYVDARVGSDIFMSNTVEIVVNKSCKLEVKSGNSSTETIFSWNELNGASEYDVKIWKDTLWEGDPYLIEWGIKTNSWKAVLPEGTYYAYVDARVGSDIRMSNTVEIVIYKGCKLEVKSGNTSTETIFSWNELNGASEYDVKIWKDTLWEGDPYLIEWGIKTNSWETVLPKGTYYVYVDARVGSDICMSNTVEIVVNKGCKLEVKAGNSSTKTIFSWNELKEASEYDVKIWKDALWEGDPYLIKWSIKTNSWETVLPEGTYYAYVDARIGSDICISNVQKFNIEEKISIVGDINADGEIDESDAVILQEWLLATPDTELANWKTADLCEDGIIDVYDLILLRKLISDSK